MSFPLSVLVLSNVLTAIVLLAVFGICLSIIRAQQERTLSASRLFASQLWELLGTIEKCDEGVPYNAEYRAQVRRYLRHRWSFTDANSLGEVAEAAPSINEFADLQQLDEKLENLYGTATAGAEIADSKVGKYSYLQVDMSNEGLTLFKAFKLCPGELYFRPFDGRLFKKSGDEFIALELTPMPVEEALVVEEPGTSFALVSVRRMFGMVLEAQLVLCPREEATHHSVIVFDNGESFNCYAKKAT